MMMEPLILEQVEKSFKDGDKENHIVKNLSFRLKTGEVVAIIGPSGSGKSTFLSIAGALQSPDKGKVIVNGTDIATFSDIEKANIRLNHLGYIFQTSNLVPYLKVEEQLSLVLKMANQWTKESKRKINDMLVAVGMEQRSKFYPHQLSGGEKQRVAIARAFINDPEIILADEPTASLDSNRSMSIIELIAKIVKEQNKSAIIVTHDEQILPLCDRIYVMKDGQLMEKGNKSE
ncbi:hemin ABC transporter ATP-binding protein [Bacillus sp. AFS073361]|uniref:ABC transporter ATP-binding protein n=1 Tax=Bacillus sp. AFS073361 TaxID=2033511 RepID=UPI000BF62751|nr:ABC transporter ATP-binding protein [Bacillus sp. AFS073361]PFP26820.1 hemin ABC transporter ATP-binding protein [Bacillus sp. AFS073361]